MTTDQKILNCCLEFWNENFCGITSWKVSSELDIDHETVRETFRKFKNENKGTLNDDVIIPLPEGGAAEQASQPVLATIFFPSEDILKKYFRSSELAGQHLPPYREKMHLGQSRSTLCYFPPEVLNRYIAERENYQIYDTFCGGFISMSTEKQRSSGKEGEEEGYTIRYGKRKIDAEERVVCVILDDLAVLNDEEQRYWHSFEMQAPAFNVHDPDFHEYYLRYYKTTPVDSYDPLHELQDIIKKINALPHVGNLFKKIDSARLKYPVKNTYENFRRCCKRLYNVIEPNSINDKTLRKFLYKNYNGYDNLKHEESEYDINELFIRFLKEINFIDNSLNKLIRKVKQQKTPGDTSGDYLDKFKKLCRDLLMSYRILHEKLKDSNSGNPGEKFLSRKRLNRQESNSDFLLFL